MKKMKTNYRISHQNKEVSRIYDEVLYKQGTYDDALWKEEQRMLEHELVLLRNRAQTISLLDFATGTGRVLSFLESRVGQAIGVDIAEEMLERARQVVQKAQLMRADITRTDALLGKTFDLITAFRFFLNAEPALRNEAMALLAQKLRDKESVLIFNMHGNLWSHRVFTKFLLRLRGKHLSTATCREAMALAERHGLQIVRWYGFGVLPKMIYRVIGSSFARRLDGFFSSIPGARHISYDLVFVCKKKQPTGNKDHFEVK